jgi:hypothetical protein
MTQQQNGRILDWTRNAAGVANSSPAFDTLCRAVADLLRRHHGGPDDVARIIVRELAHTHGLAPVPEYRVQEVQRNEATVTGTLVAADGTVFTFTAQAVVT